VRASTDRSPTVARHGNLKIGLFTPADRTEVEAEAEMLAGFLVPDARSRDIRIHDIG